MLLVSVSDTVSSVSASLDKLCCSLSWADTGAYETWAGYDEQCGLVK